MLKRNVPLSRGYKIGDEIIKSVVIREDGPADEWAGLNAGHTGDRLTMFVHLRQVCAIGTIEAPRLENPTPEAVLTLSGVDWYLIQSAIQTLNRDIAKESGLLPGTGGGRDEPGGPPPGAV